MRMVVFFRFGMGERGGQRELSMFDSLKTQQLVGDCAESICRTFEQDNLETMIVVCVHMCRGDDILEEIVLQV